MTDAKTYSGGCHCGDVRYGVTMELHEVMQCNCSICSKAASLLAFVAAERFELQAGGDRVTDYQFGAKSIHHLFCSRCGIRSFARGTGADGKPMVAVNVRCLDDVDVSALAVKHFDGRSL